MSRSVVGVGRGLRVLVVIGVGAVLAATSAGLASAAPPGHRPEAVQAKAIPRLCTLISPPAASQMLGITVMAALPKDSATMPYKTSAKPVAGLREPPVGKGSKFTSCTYPTSVLNGPGIPGVNPNSAFDLEIQFITKSSVAHLEWSKNISIVTVSAGSVSGLGTAAWLQPGTTISPTSGLNTSPVANGPELGVLSGSTEIYIRAPTGVTPAQIEALGQAIVRALGP